MSSQTLFQVPYLRTSRAFIPEIDPLTIELSKSYIDIANSVNARTIGLFSTKYAAPTGEVWFLEQNKKRQTIRLPFELTSTGTITHNLNFRNIFMFTSCYGQYTDGTNWYGLISGTSVAIAGQISFYITPTSIIFLTGAGAPALTSGILVIEWMSNV